MTLLKGDDTAAGLDEEHIEDLTVKVADILLYKRFFKRETTYRSMSRDRLGSKNECRWNVDKISLIRLYNLGSNRNGKTATGNLNKLMRVGVITRIPTSAASLLPLEPTLIV